MPPVETFGLTKRFGAFHALRDCTLRVEAGEVFGLLGPNGAGKTTLVRLLLGFMRPSSGWARVGGLDVVEQSVDVRRQVAYLPGDARLPGHMRARGLLAFFAGMHPAGSLERSLKVAERMELDLSRRIAFMSTGMRQKLALAAVLGPRTPLLILDEPTANLDPTVRGEVLQMVAEARGEGRTVIFSSHVLSEIEEVCDRVMLLRRGQLVLDQRLSELRDRHLIRGVARGPLAPAVGPWSDSVSIERGEQGRVTIDVSGDLLPALRWLVEQNIEQVRIEPVRLKTIYQGVHVGTADRSTESRPSSDLVDEEA
ncbi:ABC transporter ATP-binding protein [Candidatus Laterigemmans baculatus]|uniref:ABC transporter ATP-binding protein n=1 Tax=Candidatus Laterigemmans baculatus TaxID=2770505 RepID=UPI0013DBC9E2|nr:ABC transporter ATP-binding protein [Candidatus Laterigemmans baculatus]